MNIFEKIRSLLNKPFPLIDNWREYARTIGFISLFITFFLYIFQPFGIATIESGKFLICLGFGLVTFITSIIYESLNRLVFDYRVHTENFVFGKWILKTIGLVLLIGIANFFFARVVLFGNIRWEFLPTMIYGAFSVGIFPIVIIGLISLLKEEKKYQTLATNIKLQTPKNIVQPILSQQVIFDIEVSQIRYIEALQNYVKIYYLKAGGLLEDKLERATLKSLDEESSGDVLVRCHRSFMVNKHCILEVNGNAQGLLLSVKDCRNKVPVSRKYIEKFR